MDLTRRPSGKWIVDFGWSMTEADAALYEEPFRHVREHVYPVRQRNRRESYRVHWWRHVEPRQGMWAALDGLPRFIATPRLAKQLRSVIAIFSRRLRTRFGRGLG